MKKKIKNLKKQYPIVFWLFLHGDFNKPLIICHPRHISKIVSETFEVLKDWA